MESLDETLDEEEFVESCLMLYKTLNVEDRAHLVNFRIDQTKGASPHKHYVDENLTFIPQINPVSKAILENDQLYSIPVEERLLLRGKVKQDRIRRLQSDAFEQEMAVCTFEPAVSNSCEFSDYMGARRYIANQICRNLDIYDENGNSVSQ